MDNRIKELLAEKGMTALELSDKIGISRVSLSNIVTGKQEPSANTLNAIAGALGIPFWKLFVSESDIIKHAFITCPHCGKSIEIDVK